MSVESRIASLLRVNARGPGRSPDPRRREQQERDLSLRAGRREDHQGRAHSEGRHVGIKHDLDVLVDTVPDDNPVKPLLRDLEFLTAYATSYRYPTDEGRIRTVRREHRVQDAIDKVAAALTEVATGFGVDLDHPNAPARRIGPLR
jgi:hypothetical protein